MNAFLQLPPERRQLAFQEVDARLGLQAASVEKDFWVCWTLRELFALPEARGHLTFKGGTSLSKAWKLIQRFSEDIDLIVDKAALGFSGERAPELAASHNQRRKRIEELMGACREWVQGTLQPALTERLQSHPGCASAQLEVDPDMPDGQCLLLHYPSAFAPTAAGYVRPVVKIELGARSDDWPHADKVIRSYVLEQFPALDREAEVHVRVLSAERTFWEKACLLHEEMFRPAGKPRKLRMARHYYDLWCMIRAGVGDRALAAPDLFLRVAEHREIFFRQNWVDYTTHKPGTFRLVPPADQLPEWQADYNAMRGPMFFGDVPGFDEILELIGAFEVRFNAQELPRRR